MRIVVLLIAIALLVTGARAVSEDKKPEDKTPRIKLALPLGIVPGATQKIKLRGLHLDTAENIELSGGLTAKIISKGKADVPQGLEAKIVGDSQIEIELTAPAELPDEITAAAVTPAGKSEPHRFLVAKNRSAAADKEPNNGFQQAALLALKNFVDGQIERGQDVDVYRLTAKAGQKITVEIVAARAGSPLDALVTLHLPNGSPLATNDDHAGTRDPKLETTIPADGVYFIAIQDANDQGGPLHHYRLLID